MANLRVFVSSTCFDLSVPRGQLGAFIEDLGFQPVMSDYNDVLYDPREHTHTSCINEVVSCDMVLVLVGSRFGGKAIPAAIAQIDFEALSDLSKSGEILKDRQNISITQMEVLHAINSSIPVFTFIDERVWNDHATYEKNKGKRIAPKIEYASIDKPETAKYVFEFINFLRLRTINNSISTYHRYSDIEETLLKQWSSLFQRLLSEQRTRSEGTRRIDNLTEQFEDLKTAILTSIGSNNEKAVAKGVVRYRRLIDFLAYICSHDTSLFLTGNRPWKDFIKAAGFTSIARIELQGEYYPGRFTTALILKDGTFIAIRGISIEIYERDWMEFIQLSTDIRTVIYEAIVEMGRRIHLNFRKYDITLNKYMSKKIGNDDGTDGRIKEDR